MKFYIKTSKGFYKNALYGNTFSKNKNNAFMFDDFKDASLVLHALLVNGAQGQILKEGDNMKNSNEVNALLDIAQKSIFGAAGAAENPKSSVIQVVIVEPLTTPYKMLIPNTLETFTEIVSGHYENIFIGRTTRGGKIGIIVNAEGGVLGLPFNRKLMTIDVITGTFFITAYNKNNEHISLTDKEAEFYINRFSPVEVYI